LHLIFGQNEAGKSSALRALRNALFGMDARDAHLHASDMLRVGLKVRTGDDRVLDVERRKGKGLKSLIFVASGKPLPVEDWARVLPVDSAELFEQMFGLDYDRLIQGGRQLAALKGDVGAAILAASGDLGESVAKMRAYQERAEEIYAPQASSRPFNRALKEFRDAEARIRNEKFTSNEYKAALARANDLERELREIADELVRYAQQRNHLMLLQTAAPHVRLFIQAEAELDKLKDSVLLPAEFEQRYNKLTSDRHLAVGRRHEAQAELTRLQNRLAVIPRQPELAALVSEVDRLKEQAGRIEKARVDLPIRQTEHRGYFTQRAKLCSDWKIDTEALPRIAAEERRQIDSLAKQYLRFENKREELPKRIASLKARITETELALSALPTDMSTGALKRILKQIPAKRQSGEETQRLQRERDALKAALERDISTLPLWSGTPEQLESLRLPLPAFLSDIQTRFAEQQIRRDQASFERDKLNGEQEGLERTLAQLEAQGSIPIEDDLVRARAQRDLGWKAVKESWLHGLGTGPAQTAFLSGEEKALPEVFETSISAADSMADRLRFEADRVEKKRTVLNELERNRRRIADQEQLVENLRHETAGLDKEWRGLWKEADIQPRAPREMTEWLERRRALIEKLRDLQGRSATVVDAENEERTWRESLAEVFQVSPEQPLARLVAAAETSISETEAILNRRNELTISKRQAQSGLETEIDEQRRDELAFGEWKRQWAQAIAHLPVDATVEPAIVQELMGCIAEIETITEAMNDLQHPSSH